MATSTYDISKVSWVQKFLHRIGFLAIGSCIKFVIQFAIIIFYSHKLSLVDYGNYQFLWLYLNFFSVLSLFGFTSILLRTPILHFAAWIKGHKKIIIAGLVTINIIAVSFIFIYSSYLSTSSKLLLLLLLVLQNVATIAETLLIKNEQEKRVFFSNLTYILLYAAVHIYAVQEGYNINIIIYGVCIAMAMKTLMLLYKFKLRDSNIKRRAHIGREWLLLGINDMLSIMVKWIDKWLILFFLSAAQFAIYFNATYEIPIFLLLLSAVGNISLVELSKDNVQDLQKVKKLFHNSSTLLACIAFPSFWFLMLYAPQFIILVFGDKYQEAIQIFQISILVIPVRIIYSTTLLQIYNKTNLIIKGSVIDFVLAVLLMVILYPIWGLKGLALAFVVSTYLQVGYYMYHSAKLLKQPQTFFLPVLKLIIYFTIFGILTWVSKLATASLANNEAAILGFMLCSCMVVFAGYWAYRKMGKES